MKLLSDFLHEITITDNSPRVFFTLADELQGEVLLNKDIFLMRTALISLTVSSLSLLLGIFADFEGYGFQAALGYIAGALFWLFLAGGYWLLFKLSKRRKEFEKDNPDAPYIKRQKRPGILTFFSNRWAALADLVLPISFIILLLILFIPLGKVVTFIAASAFALSAHMHSVLNGINFKYILYISKKKRRVCS